MPEELNEHTPPVERRRDELALVVAVIVRIRIGVYSIRRVFLARDVLLILVATAAGSATTQLLHQVLQARLLALLFDLLLHDWYDVFRDAYQPDDLLAMVARNLLDHLDAQRPLRTRIVLEHVFLCDLAKVARARRANVSKGRVLGEADLDPVRFFRHVLVVRAVVYFRHAR